MLYQHSVLDEPLYVQSLYSEYTKLINIYQNIKRPSVFARYFNINKNASVIDTTLKSTYDKFGITNGIQYDLYEYTPLFYTSSVINDSTDATDLIGKMFQGSLSVTTYTIVEPQINDILVFPYSPTKGEEIFRVSNIRSVISAKDQIENPVFTYELILEYAPIKDVTKLKIYKQYVYLLTEEKNVTRDNYVILIRMQDKLQQLLTELQIYFNNKLELYSYNGVYDIAKNREFYDLLAHNKFYKRYFDNIKRPYGIDKFSTKMYIDDNRQEVKDFIAPIPTTIPLLEYQNNINLYDAVALLQQFFNFVGEI